MCSKQSWWGRVLAGLLAAGFFTSAHALIEKLTPLKQILDDSTWIFLARVDSVDSARPAMVMSRVEHYKGSAPFERLPISLVGNKLNHTPELLKRVAPALPVVVFMTRLDKQLLGLAYTNGTWFQIIGQEDGGQVRWQFTHCEIYLRRTFKGTTAEMQETVREVLAGKRKPPPADPKEKPGFGPEVAESKPSPPGSASPGEEGAAAEGGPAFAVVGLAFLGPLGALLQLLFPAVLRDQWPRYRLAVYVVLALTTVVFVHYVLVQWIGLTGWWLGPAYLWGAVVFVVLAGTGMAWAYRKAARRGGQAEPVDSPARFEVCAMVFLAVAAGTWAFYLYRTGYSLVDPVAIVGAAGLCGCLHLVYRRARYAARPAQVFWTTELAFLGALLVAATAALVYVSRPSPPNLPGFAGAEEWSDYRGGPLRRGSFDDHDQGPSGKPRVLWTFRAAQPQGRVSVHGSPVVVNDQIYVGVLHEVLGTSRGILFCVSATEREISGRTVKAGEVLWRFNAGGSLKGVFSPVTVAAGKVYFGEGYHQDSHSRLFCLDATTGEWLWSRGTTSHVEAAPLVAGSRVIFGAGDDGVVCLDLAARDEADPKLPATRWVAGGMHVDCSPLLIGNRVYAGSVLGDPGKPQDLLVVAIDRDSGKIMTSVEAPLPVCSAPAYAHGRLFFGLGNGKFNEDVAPPRKPAGALWCLDSRTLRRLWEYRVDNAVFGTPALMDDRLFFASKSGWCYCLMQEDGTSEIWKVNLGAPVVASPVAAGGKVYLVTIEGVVHCLDAASGRELWKFEELGEYLSEPDVYSSLFLYKGRLYVGAGDRLVCLGVE